MYIGRARLCVCLCVAVTACLCVCLSVTRRMPTLLHLPDVTWGNGRECPYLCIIKRICNRCTGFVAMATYAPNAKCQRGQWCSLCGWFVFVLIGYSRLRLYVIGRIPFENSTKSLHFELFWKISYSFGVVNALSLLNGRVKFDPCL